MKRFGIASLLVLALSLGGCVIAPYGPPRRVYVAPVAVAPVAVVGVRVYR